MTGADKINNISKLIVVIFVILVVIIFGCLSSPNGGGSSDLVHSISTGNSLKISSTEVKNINYSHVKPIIENEGYNTTNNSSGENIEYVFSKMENNTNYPTLIIFIYSNSDESRIRVGYNPVSPFPESELEEKKEYVKDRVNEVAEVCNLTIDWSQVKWTVNYA